MEFGILSLVCFILGGMFNAMMDSRLDLREKTRTYQWCQKRGEKYLDWYNSVGGNDRWNPSYPSIPGIFWGGDFWHTAKWFMILSWTFGAIFANLSSWPWYIFLVAHGCHGFSFVYFYHYYIPTEPWGTFKDYLKRVFLFWVNAHKKG